MVLGSPTFSLPMAPYFPKKKNIANDTLLFLELGLCSVSALALTRIPIRAHFIKFGLLICWNVKLVLCLLCSWVFHWGQCGKELREVVIEGKLHTGLLES